MQRIKCLAQGHNIVPPVRLESILFVIPKYWYLTLYPICYIKNIASFSINNSNFQIFSKKYSLHFKNSLENILKNGTFAPPGANFPFLIILKKKSYISKASKGACVEYEGAGGNCCVGQENC